MGVGAGVGVGACTGAGMSTDAYGGCISASAGADMFAFCCCMKAFSAWVSWLMVASRSIGGGCCGAAGCTGGLFSPCCSSLSTSGLFARHPLLRLFLMSFSYVSFHFQDHL